MAKPQTSQPEPPNCCQNWRQPAAGNPGRCECPTSTITEMKKLGPLPKEDMFRALRERSQKKWGPVSWRSQMLGAGNIENTTGSDPCGQPGSHLVVFSSEDRETGPHPRATRRPRDWTPVSRDLSHLLICGKPLWARDSELNLSFFSPR